MKTCTRCTVVLPETAFGPNKKGKNGLSPICRSCLAEKARQFRQTPEGREFTWKYNHSPRRREVARSWRERNKRYCSERNTKIKLDVILHYGGRCEDCGITDTDVLTIDHINGNGQSHRKEIGCSSNAIWRWLQKNNYPKDNFALVCRNCNWKRYIIELQNNIKQGKGKIKRH